MPNLESSQNSSRPSLRVGEIRVLAEEGCSLAEIGRRLGIAYNTVKSLARQCGIKRRTYVPQQETIERIRELAPMLTRQQIAAQLGLKYNTVKNYCLRNDLTPIDSPRYRGGGGGFHDRGLKLDRGNFPIMRPYEDAAVPEPIGRFIPPDTYGRSRSSAGVAAEHPMAGVGL